MLDTIELTRMESECRQTADQFRLVGRYNEARRLERSAEEYRVRAIKQAESSGTLPTTYAPYKLETKRKKPLTRLELSVIVIAVLTVAVMLVVL